MGPARWERELAILSAQLEAVRQGRPAVVAVPTSSTTHENKANMKALTPAGTPVAIADDKMEVRMQEVGEMTVAFIRLAKGVDLGPALVGLPGDLCPCPHWGYMIEGRLLMRTADGEHTYEAGQGFYWGPGHAPVALEDCSYVDFSPTKEFNAVVRHIQDG